VAARSSRMQREDHWHALVDRLHDFVCGRREDGERDGRVLGIAKCVVAAARVIAGQVLGVGFLRVVVRRELSSSLPTSFARREP
jgi:hypothetical protein